jgi:hypothetical protein
MNDVLWITTRRVPGLAHDTHEYGEERAFHAFWFATALEDREIPRNSLTLVLGHTRHTGAGKGAAEAHACTGPTRRTRLRFAFRSPSSIHSAT